MKIFRFKISPAPIIILTILASGFFLLSKPDIIDSDKKEYRVMKVYDGDTIAVLIDGERESVRLIGIDAPETDNPYTSKECYGNESKTYLNSILLGKMVELEKDKLNDDKDKYKRLLRHVFLNNENIGLKIIKEGQARLQYGFPHIFEGEFKSARDQAKEKKLGLWGKCELTY